MDSRPRPPPLPSFPKGVAVTRIELYFALIVVAIWTAVQRYGVTALVTDQARRTKHAAAGRATRRAGMHWLGAGHRLEGLRDSAVSVTARLRSEREARTRRAAMALLAA